MSLLWASKENIRLREADSEITQLIAYELNIPSSLASVLAGRNLRDFESCKRYFRPELSHTHDPFIFTHMERAARRILDAIKSGEPITVYGDYDVDGVTSTVLVVRVLRQLGAKCDYHLPNRLVDGYGISKSSIKQIAQNGTRLIVTVDCGITAIDEVREASSLGIDCIITDHHEPKETLPDALAIIDHKVPGCPYPDKSLAGVGVAFKLCQALAVLSGRGEELWIKLLDLVALGTAADIVPMLGENRVIASLGFEQMTKTENTGLKALIEVQGLTGRNLSTAEAVFQLAPCINAVGRLGDPKRGVELLLTDDPALARLYAAELRETNLERRALDSSVAQEAFEWVEKNCRPDDDFALVLGNPDWHVGVIGIVASKLVEKYHRPTVLFSVDNNGMARGSGRSIPGFHLLNALNDCGDILSSYGGHAAAAGVSIQQGKIEQFREKFNETVKKSIDRDDLVRHVTADAEVSITSLTPKFLRIIKQMAPFGPGNMRPVFLCKDLQNRYAPRVVGRKHLKLALTREGMVMDAIAFNFGERIAEISKSESLQIAFSLEENVWNGKTSLQMNVKGICS
ncbi:Single-stranded-DNA-specific exonuclease RecJ [Chitinispirillum alkaliphilum]|nr:Single-stranded-DNA-specific exonuclease RecJ [Chitinispirillum alkaliphilum]